MGRAVRVGLSQDIWVDGRGAPAQRYGVRCSDDDPIMRTVGRTMHMILVGAFAFSGLFASPSVAHAHDPYCTDPVVAVGWLSLVFLFPLFWLYLLRRRTNTAEKPTVWLFGVGTSLLLMAGAGLASLGAAVVGVLAGVFLLCG